MIAAVIFQFTPGAFDLDTPASIWRKVYLPLTILPCRGVIEEIVIRPLNYVAHMGRYGRRSECEVLNLDPNGFSVGQGGGGCPQDTDDNRRRCRPSHFTAATTCSACFS